MFWFSMYTYVFACFLLIKTFTFAVIKVMLYIDLWPLHI